MMPTATGLAAKAGRLMGRTMQQHHLGASSLASASTMWKNDDGLIPSGSPGETVSTVCILQFIRLRSWEVCMTTPRFGLPLAARATPCKNW